MPGTQTQIQRKLSMAVMSAALLFFAAACRKTPPPAAARSSAQTDVQTPLPGIATSGKALDRASWEAEKVAHDRNISAGAGQSFAHVTYKPEVKTVEEAAVVSSMVGVSSDGHAAVFNNAPAAVLALKAGDIFMVANQFAVKVLGAETEGAQTVLLIDQAKLVDLVQAGTIHLDTPISFHGPAATASLPASRGPFEVASLLDLLATPAYAQNGTGEPATPGALQPGFNTPKNGVDGGSAVDQAKAFKKALSSGWTVENWSVTPADNSAVITAKMTKDTAGFLGAVFLDGTFSNFRFAQNLTFPVNTSELAGGVKGMSGKIHCLWQIGKNTPGIWATEDKLRLPAGVTIPLGPMLGGLPMTLDVSAALLIHPGLTGGGEYSSGAFTIGFDGNNNSEGVTFDITRDQNISPTAPNAMVIAFAAPRVELQVSPLGPFASIKGIKIGATAIDNIASRVASKILPPDLLAALHKSPLGNFSISNVLASNADVYVQIVHTEGVTQSATLMGPPCTKVELKIDGQAGVDAQLMGLPAGNHKTGTIFTKTYTHWKPDSQFCKSV